MSLQDKWCLVRWMFSLWIVLGCRWRLSSQVERGEFSFAHVSLDSPFTLFTGHVAAPVVLAVASLHHFVHVGVVASAAAHQVAAVTPIGGLVALPGRKKNAVSKRRAFQNTALWWCRHLTALQGAGWSQLQQTRGRAESPDKQPSTPAREAGAALTSPAMMPRTELESPVLTRKITLNSCSDSVCLSARASRT